MLHRTIVCHHYFNFYYYYVFSAERLLIRGEGRWPLKKELGKEGLAQISTSEFVTVSKPPKFRCRNLTRNLTRKSSLLGHAIKISNTTYDRNKLDLLGKSE